MKKLKILIINGPNLNLLGIREKNLYGITTLKKIMQDLKNEFKNCSFKFIQTNSESKIITLIQKTNIFNVICNLGAFSHTSIAIRDAFLAKEIKPVNLHITNIYEREDFRKVDYLSDIANENIIGKGIDSYKLAVKYLILENEK